VVFHTLKRDKIYFKEPKKPRVPKGQKMKKKGGGLGLGYSRTTASLRLGKKTPRGKEPFGKRMVGGKKRGVMGWGEKSTLPPKSLWGTFQRGGFWGGPTRQKKNL